MSPADQCRRALEAWTGFSHALFVQSGTAALRLALDVLVKRGSWVRVPAIACWTLTGAVLDSGCRPVFGDVDRYLGLRGRGMERGDALIGLEPWGTSCDWAALAGQEGVRLLDQTLSVHGGWPGRKAAEVFDGSILSLGYGKPFEIGGGGVLLLRDAALWREAQSRLHYGRRQMRWVSRTDRYVFPAVIWEQLAARLKLLERKRQAQARAREAWSRRARKSVLPLTVLEPRPGALPGCTVLVPVCLDEGFPLHARDVFAVAMAEGIPLGIHPVSPAYLEPAGRRLRGACPDAESLASHLLFLPSDCLDDVTLRRVKGLLEALERDPETFRRPYAVSASAVRIPAEYAHWCQHAIVCRRLDGAFCVHDPLAGRTYRVDASVVRALQEGTGHEVPRTARKRR